MSEFKQFSRIQDTALDLESFDPIQSFPECGGIGVFVGTVRNHHEGKAVKTLKYTAYAPVAEKMIRQIEQEIRAKYGVSYVRVIHRIGTLDIGEKPLSRLLMLHIDVKLLPLVRKQWSGLNMKCQSGKKNFIWMAAVNMLRGVVSVKM